MGGVGCRAAARARGFTLPLLPTAAARFPSGGVGVLPRRRRCCCCSPVSAGILAPLSVWMSSPRLFLSPFIFQLPPTKKCRGAMAGAAAACLAKEDDAGKVNGGGGGAARSRPPAPFSTERGAGRRPRRKAGLLPDQGSTFLAQLLLPLSKFQLLPLLSLSPADSFKKER